MAKQNSIEQFMKMMKAAFAAESQRKRNSQQSNMQFSGKNQRMSGPLIPSVPQKVTNLAAIAAPYKNYGAFSRQMVKTTMTQTAGNKTQAWNFWDIGTELLALDSTEDDQTLDLDFLDISFDCHSTDPFILTPVLIEHESSEAFTTVNSNEQNPILAIDAGLGGHFALKIGKEIRSKKSQDNGSVYYYGKDNFSFIKEVRKWLRKIQAKQFDIKLLTDLELLLVYQSSSAQQVLNIDYIIEYASSLRIVQGMGRL